MTGHMMVVVEFKNKQGCWLKDGWHMQVQPSRPIVTAARSTIDVARYPHVPQKIHRNDQSPIVMSNPVVVVVSRKHIIN